MAAGLRSGSLGLKLCKDCTKCNDERLKTLNNLIFEKETPEFVALKEDLEDLKKDINKVDLESIRTALLQNRALSESILENIKSTQTVWKHEIEDIRTRIEDKAVQMQNDIVKSDELNQKWSDVIKRGVESLTTELTQVNKTVTGTSTLLTLENDRTARRNNVIIYGMPETNTAQDKTFIRGLISDLIGSGDVPFVFFRLRARGREFVPVSMESSVVTDGVSQKPRPVLVKFENYSDKNLFLQSRGKLRHLEGHKNIILSNDLCISDRLECKSLLDAKKDELKNKNDPENWTCRIRGQPGSFSAHIVKKRSSF